MSGAPLRVVLFREGPVWLAQGLEHDLGVQAENLKDLMLRLEIALEQAGDDLAKRPAAPVYFQHLWPLGAGRFEPDGARFDTAAITMTVVA
jgi:hypothetical protein